jgi:hypothetical protein
MKWIFISVILLAMLDLVLIPYYISTDAGAPTPGIFILLLAGIVIYTGILTYVSIPKNKRARRPVINQLLLIPVYVFFLLHPAVFFAYFYRPL